MLEPWHLTIGQGREREGRKGKGLCSALDSHKRTGQGSGCMSQSYCQSFDRYTERDITVKGKMIV